MPSVGTATDVSTAPPRVDAPAPSEPASGDASPFATALEAAHGEIASREAPARRAEEQPRHAAHDGDGREGGARHDQSKARSSTETRTERATSRGTVRRHKPSTAATAHGSEKNAADAATIVERDATPGTAGATTSAGVAARAASTAVKSAAAGGEAPADAKAQVGEAAGTAPTAGVAPAAGATRGAAVAEANAAVPPTAAAPGLPAEKVAAEKVAKKIEEETPDAVHEAATSVASGAAESGKAVAQAAARNAQEPAGEAKPSTEARHGSHDGTPAETASDTGAKASGRQRPAAAATTSGDEPAREAAVDERTAPAAEPRLASAQASIARPTSSQPKTEDASTKTRGASVGIDGDTPASARQNGQATAAAVAPAERQSESRANVDVANGRHAAAHHHPGATSGEAPDGDTFEATVADRAGVSPGSSATQAADAKSGAQATLAPAAARLQTTEDQAATAEPGRAAGGVHGAGEQAASAAATTAEARSAASTQPPADAGHVAAAPRGDTTVAASWAERVVESVRVATLRGGGEMRLRLEPAGLGNIDVRISLGHDGVRATIVAEHDTTRALLRNEQHLLHAALERSDLRLAGFSVDLGSGGSSNAFADAEHQARRSGEAGGERAADVPPEIVAMDAPAPPGRLSVRV